MGAREALVDARVAEAPVALVAEVAAPEALVGPGEAAGAEAAALEPARRVLRRQRASPIRTPRDVLRHAVPVRGEHVRRLQRRCRRRLPATRPRPLPLLERRVPEPEPMQTPLARAVAAQAEVPVAVAARAAVVVQLVLDVRSPAPRARDRRLRVVLRPGPRMLRVCRRRGK